MDMNEHCVWGSVALFFAGSLVYIWRKPSLRGRFQWMDNGTTFSTGSYIGLIIMCLGFATIAFVQACGVTIEGQQWATAVGLAGLPAIVGCWIDSMNEKQNGE